MTVLKSSLIFSFSIVEFVEIKTDDWSIYLHSPGQTNGHIIATYCLKKGINQDKHVICHRFYTPFIALLFPFGDNTYIKHI